MVVMQQIHVGCVHQCKTTTPIPSMRLGKVSGKIHLENAT